MALLLGGLFFSLEARSHPSENIEWLRLLRYKKNVLLPGFTSEADSPTFFLHEMGKHDPYLEYEELKKKIFETNSQDQNNNIVCRFPARVFYLKKSEPNLKIPESKCDKFEVFKNGLKAKTVSLVFSSYYLNNPASSFGHTFLRLGKGIESSELLDTGINYGAATGNANPIVFVLGAFTGYFQGTFNAIPYYYKVREYNDFESRDLWTYHLNFSQEEIDQLVRHIWELDQGGFRYYFLTENCSYHALTMLEAIRPELNLIKYLPDRYIIPSDTLKVIVDQNIVTKITMRPSASTQFYRLLEELNESEKIQMKSLLENQELQGMNDQKSLMKIYDTSLSYLDYKYAEEILKKEEKPFKLKRSLLLKRANIPLQSEELTYPQKENEKPHEGHSSGRLSIGSYRFNNTNLLGLNYRFAFHDFLDFQKSYMNNARVEMFSFKSLISDTKFNLTDFSIADYYSVGAFDSYSKAFSWKLRFGQWQTFQNGQDGLNTTGMMAGFGYSYQLKNISPFLLASLESSYVSEKYHKIKLSPGADVGVLIRFNDHLRFQSLFEWRLHPWKEDYLKNELRLMNHQHGIGFFYHRQTYLNFDEYGLQYHLYLK